MQVDGRHGTRWWTDGRVDRDQCSGTAQEEFSQETLIVGGVGVDGDVMNRAIDGTPDLMSGRRASLRPTIFS